MNAGVREFTGNYLCSALADTGSHKSSPTLCPIKNHRRLSSEDSDEEPHLQEVVLLALSRTDLVWKVLVEGSSRHQYQVMCRVNNR